jgi:hypothetical protein
MLFIGPFELLAARTANEEQAPGRAMAQQATKKKQFWITADHSKHEILQQEFTANIQFAIFNIQFNWFTLQTLLMRC